MNMKLYTFVLVHFFVWPLHAKHSVSVTTDYFDKNFDVVNYIDKIDTSSIPEQLTRLKVRYDYDLGSINVGISGGIEKGRITRQSEPYEVSNQFNQYAFHIGQRSQNKRHRTQLDIGHIQQKNITLDCVQRSGVLLGGNCLDADFRLLDGDLFAQTGERTYLPVLSSEASADFAKNTSKRSAMSCRVATWRGAPDVRAPEPRFGSRWRTASYS